MHIHDLTICGYMYYGIAQGLYWFSLAVNNIIRPNQLDLECFLIDFLLLDGSSFFNSPNWILTSC